MMTAIIFLVSLAVGYYLFLLFSHPQKKQHKVPTIRFKRLQVLPNMKIYGRSKTYHIHHWVLLSVVFAVGVVAYEGLMRSPLVNGMTIGGILQGLRYKDRFKIRYPKQLSEPEQ